MRVLNNEFRMINSYVRKAKPNHEIKKAKKKSANADFI